jgi:hypothetical protein
MLSAAPLFQRVDSRSSGAVMLLHGVRLAQNQISAQAKEDQHKKGYIRDI